MLDPSDAHLARQHPGDYLQGIEATVRAAIVEATASDKNFSADQIVGIGVDSTGSSPIPVNEANEALAMQANFADNLAAQCWLWKDHTSHAEAGRHET